MDIRTIDIADALPLLELHHGYGGAGKCATYAFGVYEDGRLVDAGGVRRSTYSGGKRSGVTVGGHTTLTRWEHRACTPGSEAAHMAAAGWVREATGKVWRSGNPAYRWVKRAAPRADDVWDAKTAASWDAYIHGDFS